MTVAIALVTQVLLLAAAQDAARGAAPQTTQPSAAPASAPTGQDDAVSGLTRPAQSEIVRELIQRTQDRPIMPVSPVETVAPVRPAGSPSDPNLLMEGSMQIDRPGRLERQDDRSRFVFVPTGAAEAVSLELNRNQLLELMEREAASGTTEFVVTAEVTQYRGANYLTLRKVLKRVSNANLSP